MSESDGSAGALERERLEIERQKLKLERQRLTLEVMHKRREFASSSKNSLRDIFTNPLILAIVGGFISIMSTIIAGSLTAWASREAEKQKAELASASAQDALQAELIKKFTEGPRLVVRENLNFLIDAGLARSRRPPMPVARSVGWSGGFAAFEAPALVAGLDDVAVVGKPIEQRSSHLGVAEHGGPSSAVAVSGERLRKAAKART